MNDKPWTLEDARRAVRLIENGAKVRAFNQMLITFWMSPGREFDDAVFVDKLWKPLHEGYGDLGIISLDQLEGRTGRGLESRRVGLWDPSDRIPVNGHSYAYHRIVCKLLQVCIG